MDTELIETLVDLIAPWYVAGEQESGDYIDPDNIEMMNRIRGHIRDIERDNLTKVLEHLRKIDWRYKEILEHEIDLAEGMIAWTENNFLPGPNGDKYIAEHKILIELLSERLKDADL